MPSYSANGLVLHRINLGETDKIVTLYTRELGKISAVAKGARKGNSRLSGATELFTLSRFLLGTGKSLDIVQQCEISAAFSSLRLDLERMARATYFCELLDRFTAERDASSSAELLDLTVSALRLLEQAAPQILDLAVHAYELRLLDTLGYAPVLTHCVRCGEPIHGRQIGFSPALGGVLCAFDRFKADDAQALSGEAAAMLQMLGTEEPEAWRTQTVTPKIAADMARALRWYIRARTERNLKSADFLDSLRAGQSA